MTFGEPAKIQTLVFDLDDTLFPERHFSLSGYRAVHEWQLSRLGLKDFLSTALHLSSGSERGRVFDRTLEALGAVADSKIIQDMITVFREHLPTLELHEDARWAVDYFKAQDRNLAIITDGFLTTQQNKVRALNVESCFHKIIYTDAFGGRAFWKPHPMAFEEIMKTFPGAPGAFVYIADNPVKDFIAPKALGWQTIQVERPSGVYHGVDVPRENCADRTIHSLRELEGL